MIKNIDVTNKEGVTENVSLKLLDISYVDKIMELQQNIIDNLEDKDLLAASELEEFIEIINSKGKIIGCLNNKGELIAIGVYARYMYNEHNYGYDLDIEGEQLLKVAQIESTVVSPDYRGNGLQKIICSEIENLAVLDKMEIISATVAPDNKFSLNTFISMGYEIYTEKLKYDGLRRYILKKMI